MNIIYNQMGQSEATAVKRVEQSLGHTLLMVDGKRELPSYFSSSAQKVIQELENISKSISQHPLELYLINALDLRYSRQNRVNVEALEAGKSRSQIIETDQSQFQNAEWAQLESKEIFLKTLASQKRQYLVESLIKEQYLSLSGNGRVNQGYQTLRKPLSENSVNAVMDQQLLMRLFYHYYLVMIKNYANSGNKHVFKFHQDTGRQLCHMIQHGYLSLQQLYSLFYFMVFIDKHPHKLQSKLNVINRLYHFQCLKTFYTINIEQSQLQKHQRTARLYLDQLYMNSIKEAEDPEIKMSDDSLTPIRVFPISRVKDRPRP